MQPPWEGPGHLRRPVQAPTPPHAPRPGRRASLSGEAALRPAEPRSRRPGSVPSPARAAPCLLLPGGPARCPPAAPIPRCRLHQQRWGGPRASSPASSHPHSTALLLLPIDPNWDALMFCGHKSPIAASRPPAFGAGGPFLRLASDSFRTQPAMSSIAQPRLGEEALLSQAPRPALRSKP